MLSYSEFNNFPIRQIAYISLALSQLGVRILPELELCSW